jgi:hypothetical protein
MKKGLFLFLAGAALTLPLGLAASAEKENPATAAAASSRVDSRIQHVTVYPNSALVSREVSVPAGAGTCELVVSPLPVQTVDSSLYSEGTEGIRVLTTRYRQRPIREDTREEVRKLEDEIRKLAQTGQKLQADIQAAQQNMQMLGKLEDFTAVTTKTSDKSALNSESIIALSKYVMESRANRAKEIVSLQQDMQTNKEQLEFVRRQLQDLTAGTAKVERDAVIVVDKVNAAPGKIRLNYLVSSAAWRPQYKFRAGKTVREAGKVVDEPVQLEYLAAVIQQTGEDWAGVGMTLSTAQPMLNAAPPDLKVLEVAVMPRGQPNPMPQGIANPNAMEFNQRAKELRSQGQQEFLKKDVANASKQYNDAAALEATWQLLFSSREEIEALRGQPRGVVLSRGNGDEGPSVTCHLPTKLSVPSRHDEQIIEVAKIDMTPEYFYKAVPALTAHVYRQANITNKSKYVLLPGEATMYQGTDFVGRMNLPLVAIGEQFTVGFGVDPQMQIVRQMTDKTKTTQGGNQVLKFEYRILVNSYKPEPVNLQVWDRLPHAEMESVGVSLLKSAPELSKDSLYLRECRPNNLLRWDLKIEPTMNGEKAYAVNYEFQMALDKNMAIGGLLTK